MIRLSDRARAALRPGEVLVLDRHRVALCTDFGLRASLGRLPGAF